MKRPLYHLSYNHYPQDPPYPSYIKMHHRAHSKNVNDLTLNRFAQESINQYRAETNSGENINFVFSAIIAILCLVENFVLQLGNVTYSRDFLL